MRKNLLSIYLLTLAGFFSANGQIVTNGSFENVGGNTCNPAGAGCTPCFYCGPGTTFDGWVADNVDLFNKTATGVNNFAGGVPDGNYAVDLNGKGPGTIYQIVNGLIPGQEYTISFLYSNNDARPTCNQDKPFQLNVYAYPSNELLYTEIISTAGLSVTSNVWKPYTLSGLTPNGSVKVEFKSLFGLTSPAAPVPNCGYDGDPFATVFGPALDFVKIESSTLPLRLTEFTGNYSGSTINLNWKTEIEEDVLKMVVQYYNGSTWQDVATVLPTGIGSANSYNTSIPSSAVGNKAQVTFRLMIVSLNGGTTYSKVLSLANSLADIRINLSPNPTFKGITSIFGLKGGETITVFNAAGQRFINRKATSNVEQIDLSRFANGVYNVMIVSKEGKVVNTKLVKE